MSRGSAQPKVGILAGAFNPPHSGHLHISAEARRLLGLDEVWWLVTPNHPLKPNIGYGERLAKAERVVADHRWLKLDKTEEQINGTNYTYLSLEALKARHPQHEMVFLLGYDAFGHVCDWRQWRRALAAMPWAVFPRRPPPSSADVDVSADTSAVLADYRCDWRRLLAASPPAWALLPSTPHPGSSSSSRNGSSAREDK